MDEILVESMKVVAAIVAPVLAGLIVALLTRALKKLGLELDAERQAKTEYLVRQAILRAEEWAASRIKGAGATVTAQQKLVHALTDVMDRVPGITREEASALIHAELPKIGAGASSFIRAAGQTAMSGAR